MLKNSINLHLPPKALEPEATASITLMTNYVVNKLTGNHPYIEKLVMLGSEEVEVFM